MVSHLFYSQLALLVLVWLFVMLHVAESHRGTPIRPTATPIKPKSTRSNVPKPFHGLTPQASLCPVCTRYRAAQSASSGTTRAHAVWSKNSNSAFP